MWTVKRHRRTGTGQHQPSRLCENPKSHISLRGLIMSQYLCGARPIRFLHRACDTHTHTRARTSVISWCPLTGFLLLSCEPKATYCTDYHQMPHCYGYGR